MLLVYHQRSTTPVLFFLFLLQLFRIQIHTKTSSSLSLSESISICKGFIRMIFRFVLSHTQYYLQKLLWKMNFPCVTRTHTYTQTTQTETAVVLCPIFIATLWNLKTTPFEWLNDGYTSHTNIQSATHPVSQPRRGWFSLLASPVNAEDLYAHSHISHSLVNGFRCN